MNPLPTECEVLQAEMSAYLDGMLSQDGVQRLEHHVAGCSSCREEMELLRKVTQAVGRIPLPEPSPAMRERLLAQVTAETVIERTKTICVQHGMSTSIRRYTLAAPRSEVVTASTLPEESDSSSYVRSREQNMHGTMSVYRMISHR